MRKKSFIFLAFFCLLFIFTQNERANAAAITANGTFQNFTYDDNLVPQKIVMTLSGGVTRSFTVNAATVYYINKTVTTTNGYKRGMSVKLTINNNLVTAVNGISVAEAGAIVENSKTLMATVTKIDSKGMFITVQPDIGAETNYYTNASTQYVKNSKVTDRSALYEGDRVKLSFSTATATNVSEIEIITGNTTVKDLYKGELRLVNTSLNRLTVANAQPFENWSFGTAYDANLKTFTFTADTKIYAGNTLISKATLKKYAGKPIYYVTTMLNGKEIVSKLIVLLDNERSYNEQITEVNTGYSFINLQYTGRLYYHAGSILIRDGRLVEPSTLTGGGSAFVITDGKTSSNYAHVVNVTGDVLSSPNLGAQNLYFGQLSVVDMDNYRLALSDAVVLENNYWRATSNQNLSYSNSTNAVTNYNSSVVSLQPNIDLISYESFYGYFYVKDGHVQAVHLLQPSEAKSTRTITGQIQSLRKVAPLTLNLRNVSNWSNGQWVQAGAIEGLNLEQALIIKNGQAITSAQLRVGDRVTMYMTSSLAVHVVIVNE